LVAGGTFCSVVATASALALQWSPGLVAGGTPRRGSRSPSRSRRFNGAPAWSPGEPGDQPQPVAVLHDASMEPRLGRRGNTQCPRCRRGPSRRFNGAPAWSPGERLRPRLNRRPPRSFNGAPAWSPGEHAALDSVHHEAETASMEPRLGRRGNERLPPRQLDQPGQLQWSPGLVAGGTLRAGDGMVDRRRRFNGAPAWSPGEHAGGEVSHGTPHGFNGAPAWSPGERPRGGFTSYRYLLASMEPRLGRRGNSARDGQRWNVPLLQWSPGLVAGGTSRPPRGRWRSCRFNGAPAWSPGELAVAEGLTQGGALLQWSPGLVAGGTWRVPAAHEARDSASMEPRLGRRGNQRIRSAPRGRDRLQWSPGLVAGGTRGASGDRDARRTASMEPRLGRRGNCDLRGGRHGYPELQWSPGLVAGGTVGVPDRALPVLHASMEPRLGRRGNVRGRGRRPRLLPASMEPRLGRRGNLIGAIIGGLFNKLQWSPGLVAGGTGVSLRTSRMDQERFNGAPAWSPGERRNRLPFPARSPASMEPRLGRRGNSLAASCCPAASPKLQWSPGLVAGGTSPTRGTPCSRWRSFNGAPAWSPGERCAL